MGMPVETESEKEAKILTVKAIYNKLNIGEEATENIRQLSDRALGYAAELKLPQEAYQLLENYANKLIGRTK
jgi:geranylgeranyl pyrophosphate synthase